PMIWAHWPGRRVPSTQMRAHWPYLQAYLVRGATRWVAARAVAAAVAWFGNLPGLQVSAVAAVEAVPVTVVLGVVATLRHRETALIGNLAIHSASLIAALATPATVGELALRAILGGVQ